MGTQRQGRSDGAAPVQYQPGDVFNCLCIRLLFERIDALAQALNSLYKAELIDNEARPGYAPVARSARGRTRNRRLGPLVQHPPPPPRPGRHHTTTSRKPTHNNTKGSGLNKPPQNPGLDKQREGRCTRYVALHPLCGAAPEQKGCNAYGSGALPLRTSESVVSVGHGMVVEVGLDNRRRASGVVLRYRRCVWTGVQGTSHWRCTRYVALHPLCGAAPEQKGCNAYGSGAAHPITRTNAESARRPPTNSHVNPLL